MTEPVNNTELQQADYLKLFMQELTYQDPLQPLDNREFMTQMAQFSLLKETTAMKEGLSELLSMTSANQCLSLLGKTVGLNSGEDVTVTKVEFFERKPPKLMIKTAKNDFYSVDLGDIREVKGELHA